MTRRMTRASIIPILGIGLLVVSSAFLPMAEAAPPTLLDPALFGHWPTAVLTYLPEPLTGVALANLTLGGLIGLKARRKLLARCGQ